MKPITPSRAPGVDDQRFDNFVEQVTKVVSVITRRHSALIMGIDEGNWNKYLTGTNTHRITNKIIDKFDLVFHFLIAKEFPGTLANTYKTEEPQTPYKDIDDKLDELIESQKRLEEKIDGLLPKKP